MMSKRVVLAACVATLSAAAVLPLAARPVVAAQRAAGAATVSATLDREQLVKLADDYLAALVAHDPKRVPLAADLKFVENITRMQPGEGLWKTASAVPTTFRIVVPDPVTQTVGFLVMMQETVDGKANPIEVGGRLKLDGGRITEAEHVVVHAVRETSLKNLQKVRAAIPGSNTGPSPFGALGCAAQLDTQLFTYIDSIDNVRVVGADEQTGLAIGFSHFRHSMKDKSYPTFGVPGRETNTMNMNPFDLPAVHVFKIWGGLIHEIEALGFTTGYNSKTGWE